MQDFSWNINSLRTSIILRELKAFLHLWKNDVVIQFDDDKVSKRLKRTAISSGYYENYGHICFVKGTEKIDIIYDTETLLVTSFEITEGKKRKCYKPLKRASRHLIIKIKPRKNQKT